MLAALQVSPLRPEARSLLLSVIAGLACAFLIGKALPSRWTRSQALSRRCVPACASRRNS